MLHGSGERGDGTTQLSRAGAHGPNRRIREGREFPAVIITPQAPQSAGSWSYGIIDTLATYVMQTYRIDASRFYLTGLSLGGGGTWTYVRNRASRLAAAMPVCGAGTASGSDSERAALVSLPLYVIHNIDDGQVKYTRSVTFADSIGAAVGARNDVMGGYIMSGKSADTTSILNYSTGQWEFDLKSQQLRDSAGKLRSTVRTIFTFPQRGGHDAWTKFYKDEDTWNWLFCQKRNN